MAELACMIHTTYPLPRPGGLRHHQRELLPTAANRAESLYLTRPVRTPDLHPWLTTMGQSPGAPNGGDARGSGPPRVFVALCYGGCLDAVAVGRDRSGLVWRMAGRG